MFLSIEVCSQEHDYLIISKVKSEKINTFNISFCVHAQTRFLKKNRKIVLILHNSY